MITHESKAAKPANLAILARLTAEFAKRQGARVGDFIRLPRVHRRHVEFTRITHDWGDTFQTGGTRENAYYHAGSCLSYSGSLDRGIASDQLIATDETRDGAIWFFDEGYAGAGRGVQYLAPMRVFNVKAGADLSGLDELRCPFQVHCFTEELRKERGYWFSVDRSRGHGCETFQTVEALRAWLLMHEIVPNEPAQLNPPEFVSIHTHYADQTYPLTH